MMDRDAPTAAQIVGYLRSRRNWGRWGPEDQRGTLNLITASKRAEAARLATTGRVVPLSRPWPTRPAPGNPYPAELFMKRIDKGGGAGLAEDFIGTYYHGTSVTHLDALCHVWDADGMWNGRRPDEVIGFDGSSWASVDAWADGIFTRGVMLDVPAHRHTKYVTVDRPVRWSELETIARDEGVEVAPGDAVVIHSGREAWDRENPPWASLAVRPGLDASCIGFVREHDCSALVWDMTDRMPNGYGLPFGVHAAIAALGLALIDMALLEPLADACREQRRWEFLFVASPLAIAGATGSPVNPLAVF